MYVYVSIFIYILKTEPAGNTTKRQEHSTILLYQHTLSIYRL